jgi:mRNA-degrading endonuclease RelE of RelBE toxin-antitoxin system
LSGRLRYRVGDWRVIYRIDDTPRQVHVLVIAHRSEVYE